MAKKQTKSELYMKAEENGFLYIETMTDGNGDKFSLRKKVITEAEYQEIVNKANDAQVDEIKLLHQEFVAQLAIEHKQEDLNDMKGFGGSVLPKEDEIPNVTGFSVSYGIVYNEAETPDDEILIINVVIAKL